MGRAKYQEPIDFNSIRAGWREVSGNGIANSGGGIWVGLGSKKSGGRGNRGGIAQINTASSDRTMTAVFVVITYQRMS